MTPDPVLLEATFDPKVKTYWFVQGLLVMLFTVVGIPLIPFWLLGWGQWYVNASFARLACRLTTRSIIVKKGIWFRVEKTIPLDKVQDLGLRQGPLMRAFGVSSLRVETAGQSAPQGTSEADLPGIVDAREFREAVRKQRDARTEGVAGAAAPADAGARTAPLSETALLKEIRDSLKRIEKLLEKRG